MSTITKSMEEIVSLCRRRGFVWQSSEPYGGINGFWDYGPLGAELKRNLKNAWWHDVVLCPPDGLDGHPLQVVGVDCTIIMNPKVWQASGHVDGFNDPMVDCRETKNRYRADQLFVYRRADDDGSAKMIAFVEGEADAVLKKLNKIAKASPEEMQVVSLMKVPLTDFERVIGPDTTTAGTLTEPRQFNLMFETYIGAIRDEDSKSYLRPETAQGIFTQFWNIVDTCRVKVPFGIAQIGKAFRNEITPRNFTFRSREFEQAEMEFFCHPSEREKWFEYWLEQRLCFHRELGFDEECLRVRHHTPEELAHYAKSAADVEYLFPFGWQEIEGVHDRGDWDLTRHSEYSGKDLSVGDEQTKERYVPMVIETSVGIDRTCLALLANAYEEESLEGGESRTVLRLEPALAPIKAAVLPLAKKLAEPARRLERDLRRSFNTFYDESGNIGRRYRRMDEAGTPFCVTYDFESQEDGKVTVRERDSMKQDRIGIEGVLEYLRGRVETVL